MGCRVLKTRDYQITQRYGNKHNGVDLVGQGGTLDTIIAHSAGKVIFCQTGQVHNPNVSETSNLSYGNCVKILHDNGMYTLYAHLANVKVSINQRVEKGQDLGLMGNTGRAFGSHLHFEVYNSNNVRVNPEPYLNKDLDGSVECTGTITYQVYANGHWYEEVKKVDDTPQGYAGNGANFISGLRAKPQYGEILTQSHSIRRGWLSEISSKNYKTDDTQNGNTYSGIYNEPTDMIKFRCTKGWIDARALTEDGWLDWVRFTDKHTDQYIGIAGKPILGIQMV